MHNGAKGTWNWILQLLALLLIAATWRSVQRCLSDKQQANMSSQRIPWVLSCEYFKRHRPRSVASNVLCHIASVY
jgi:hypothetical protein